MNPRTRRLQSDFDLIRSSFSGHPHVRVEPLGSERPPESYVVTYRLKGLRLEGDQPVVVDEHEVELMLPRRYPAERPYVVPKSSIFHPNVKEYVCLADHWAAQTTLVDVIAKIGDMLQWKVYNPKSALDVPCAQWALENESGGLFPIGNVELGVGEIDIEVAKDSGGDADDGSPLPGLIESERGSMGHDDDFVVEVRRS